MEGTFNSLVSQSGQFDWFLKDLFPLFSEMKLFEMIKKSFTEIRQQPYVQAMKLQRLQFVYRLFMGIIYNVKNSHRCNFGQLLSQIVRQTVTNSSDSQLVLMSVGQSVSQSVKWIKGVRRREKSERACPLSPTVTTIVTNSHHHPVTTTTSS